jgi:hypothetical protein
MQTQHRFHALLLDFKLHSKLIVFQRCGLNEKSLHKLQQVNCERLMGLSLTHSHFSIKSFFSAAPLATDSMQLTLA